MTERVICISRKITGERLCWLRPMKSNRVMLTPACGGEQAGLAFPAKRIYVRAERANLTCPTCKRLLRERLAEADRQEQGGLFDGKS